MATATAAVSPKSKIEILNLVASGALSADDAAKLLASPKQPGTLHCKVSEKGGLSVYGLQRMPVTLYVGQWERLIEFVPQLAQFAKDNNGKLSRKD